MPGVAAVPGREPRVVHLDTGPIQAVAGHRQSRRHTADSVAASDHDRRPYVVYRTAYSGSTLARCNPRAGGAGLQYRVAVIISFDNDPSATESEHSFATDLLYFLAAVCPCARSGQYSRAGQPGRRGPDPDPAWGHLGRGRPAPGLGLLQNAVMFGRDTPGGAGVEGGNQEVALGSRLGRACQGPPD